MDQADPKEMQIALVGPDQSTVRQDRTISRIAADLQKVDRVPPFKIRSVPETFHRSQLPPLDVDLPVLGVDFDLAPFTFQPQGGLLLGVPNSADTALAVSALMESLRAWRPNLATVLVTPHASSLTGCTSWKFIIQDTDEAADEITQLVEQALDQQGSNSPIVIVAENVADFSSSSVDMKLQNLVKACQRAGHLYVAIRSLPASGPVPSSVNLVQNGRKGLILQAAADDAGNPLSMWLPKGSAADFPALRGYYVNGAECSMVQMPQPTDSSSGLVEQRKSGQAAR